MHFHQLSKRTRWKYATVSTILFLISVNRWVQNQNIIFDQKSLVSFHGVQYGMIFLAGMGMGIAVASSLIFGMQVLVRSIQINPTAADVDRTLKKFAWVTVGVAMSPAIIWTVASFNKFVDQHVGLMVEVDLLVLFMGLVSGSSWFVILSKRFWLGPVISFIMILMLVGSVLTKSAWGY